MKIAAIALLPLLALGLTPATGAVQPLAAATAAPDAQSLIAANAQLKARIEATAPGDTLPMLSNGDGALVRSAYDAATIRAAPLDDVQAIGGMCQGIGDTLMAYGKAIGATPGGASAQNAAVLKYQDEFSLATAAANICVQRALHSVDKLVGTMDEGMLAQLAPALTMMRGGASMTIQGTLASLELGYRPANMELMVAAMTEDSAVIAASLPKADREAIEKMVRDAIPGAAANLRPALTRLAQSFTATACNNLCKASGG